MKKRELVEKDPCFVHEQRETEEAYALPLYIRRHVSGVQQQPAYHASVPLNEDGSFKHVRIGKKEYWGHKLLQKTDQLIRTAYFDEDGSEEKNFCVGLYVVYVVRPGCALFRQG